MADRAAKPQQPAVVEPHVLLKGDYYTHWVIPASLASQVLPLIKRVKVEGYGEDRTYTLNTDTCEFELVTSETMTAVIVAARLTK